MTLRVIARPVVPWRCDLCGAGVDPASGRDRGRVCAGCRRVICTRCTARDAPAGDDRSRCRDCAEAGHAPEVNPTLTHAENADELQPFDGDRPPGVTELRDQRTSVIARWFVPLPSFGRVLQTAALGAGIGALLGAVAGPASFWLTSVLETSGPTLWSVLFSAGVGTVAGTLATGGFLLLRQRWLVRALSGTLGAALGAASGISIVAEFSRPWSGLQVSDNLTEVGMVAGLAAGIGGMWLMERLTAAIDRRATQSQFTSAPLPQEPYRVPVKFSAGEPKPSAAQCRLQLQIGRTGRTAVGLRLLLPATCSAAAVLALSRIASHWEMTIIGWEMTTIGLLAGIFLAMVILALPLSFPLAMAYRRLRLRQLRRHLSALSPEEQEAVLLPLADPRSPETREVVAPLLRELRARPPTELAPAAAPAGGGAEVAVVGEERVIP